MIRRLLSASAVGLAVAFAPAAFAQDSGASDGADGTDDESFQQGTEVTSFDEEFEPAEDEGGCSVVAGSAALGATLLSGLAVVARRRD